MSDSGGPEDPEVARLREQLAAAERVAAIRSELQAARDELATLDNVDAAPQESKGDATREQIAWRSALAIVAVAAIAAIVTLVIQGQQSDNNDSRQTSSRNSAAGLATESHEDPTLVLDCPKDHTTSTKVVAVFIGADWTWDKKVGFGRLVVNYGDGKTSGFVREANTNALSKALSHEYTQPGTYKIEAELYDKQGNKGQDSCTFVWTAKETAVSKPTTTTTIPFATKTVLTGFYQFRESSERVRKLQQTIASVTGDFISADGVYGPDTRAQHLRALGQLGLTTSRVPDTAPRPTIPTPVPPKYELYKMPSTGKGQRWGPCTGAIRVAINPNGHLDSEQTADWSAFIEDMTTEVTKITGINFSFVGQTSEVPASTYDDVYASSVDLLIFFGPPGTSTVLRADADESVFGGRQDFYASPSPDPNWYEVIYGAIHVQHGSPGTGIRDRSNASLYGKYLMHYFGRILGLSALDADVPANEIMKWGSNGSGSVVGPRWGSGDKIGLGRVGASNGCF